eukprot:4186572-Pyramimonas_sp.AAC.1
MAEWCPPPAPRSAQISAVAAAIRSATLTLRGEWEPFFTAAPFPAAAEAAANSAAAREIHEAP